MELTTNDLRLERLEDDLREVRRELREEIWRRKMLPLYLLEYAFIGIAIGLWAAVLTGNL